MKMQCYSLVDLKINKGVHHFIYGVDMYIMFEQNSYLLRDLVTNFFESVWLAIERKV